MRIPFITARKEAARLEVKRQELEARKLDIEEKKLRQNAQIIQSMNAQKSELAPEYKAPWLPAGVVPKGETPLVAQDSCATMFQYSGPQDANFYPAFMGYPALAMLTQSSDYRSVPETTATEMTREWGKFEATTASDNEEEAKLRQTKIEALEMEFKRLGIRDLIQKGIEIEMSMGRVQFYIDLDHSDDSLPFVASPLGVKKGSLKGFKVIEPMWSTPSQYNASNPTAQDFFVPERWYVMGRDTHSDRLITVVMRPVPDMLKPAYNFGGMSMLQLMVPYVQRYQRTADSVADLVRSFSLSILSTDMSAILAGANDPNIMLRASLFNQHRDNTGLMLLDRESEELSQINTPLTGLSDILTKAQEQMAGPSHTPLVKLLGITPSGLNANSDGEIRVYYDYIMAQNNAHIRPVVERMAELVQLSLFGEVDNSIVWKFNPLYQLDDLEAAQVQEVNARTDALLVDGGIVSQEEARKKLASNSKSGYADIEVADIPVSTGEFDLGEWANEAQADNP